MEIDTSVIASSLSRIARAPNRASNVLGAILVAVGTSTLDWTKILSGDALELKKLGALAIAGALSWYIGKPPEPKAA